MSSVMVTNPSSSGPTVLTGVTFAQPERDVDLDTADTYRFDLPFAEDKLNWIRLHPEVDDSVKALSKTSVRTFRGHLVSCSHESKVLGCTMNFKVFLPPLSQLASVPQLYYLPGIGCTPSQATERMFAFERASYWGIALIIPDISPREAAVEGDTEDADFGKASGWYLNATQSPWKENYQMYDYIVNELRVVVTANFPVRYDATSIMGHSIGGHAALLMKVRNPDTFASCSALAPVCHPTTTPWRRAYEAFLGNDPNNWKPWDLVEFLQSLSSPLSDGEIEFFIDQGTMDDYLDVKGVNYLCPKDLEDACKHVGVKFTYRGQVGYDHGYEFVRTFLPDHIDYHAYFLCPDKFAQRSCPKSDP